MEKEFWQEKWQADETGFHQDQVHPLLEKHLLKIETGENKRVFVPLCGKSRDMLYWADCGYRVVGVELSSIAAKAFYRENALSFEQTKSGEFLCFSNDDIEILCGDFFTVSRAQLGTVSSVFDRAALIALPASMRQAYVEKMKTLLKTGTEILLIALEYEKNLLKAPPFSISHEEISNLYSGWCDIELLEKAAATVKGKPGFERVYRMEVG